MTGKGPDAGNDDDDSAEDENNDHDDDDGNDTEKIKKSFKNSAKCSENHLKRSQNEPNYVLKAIRKCSEIGPKIVQTVKWKLAFIFSLAFESD